MRTRDLLAFIKEREAIRLKKEAGKPKPWTKDPILQSYSFCNVHREDDRVTRWVAKNWREPNVTDPNLWFAMAVARAINWPDTLAELGYPRRWNAVRATTLLEARAARGEKVYTGAYMLRSDSGSKAGYTCHVVLGGLWGRRKLLAPTPGDSLYHFFAKLQAQPGWGSFLAAQVVADLKYTPALQDASDWWTFAASGPGSRRGLNRVCDRAVDTPWKEEEWQYWFGLLGDEISPLLEKTSIGKLHAQDLQNCLCEFDKYERVRLGEGRPRSLYPGKGV